MKLSTVALALFLGNASAFTIVPGNVGASSSASMKAGTSLSAALNDDEPESASLLHSRRASLRTMTSGLVSALLLSNAASPAFAGSLLDDFGADPTKIKDPATSAASSIAKPAGKTESVIEPNLRSNYYYPTNKKRYLPRIKKCNDAIPMAADSIGREDWEAVDEFVNKVADDTILPMKLYTSSLLGGGTNVKVSFTKDMNNSTTEFEKAQKALVKAVKKQDQKAASTALEGMATSLLAYRTAGRLLGPDGGGDIPSVDDIRRSACRVQGRTFEKRVKDRDARLAEAGASLQ